MNNEWFKNIPLQSIDSIETLSQANAKHMYRVVSNEKTYFLLLRPDQTTDFYAAEIKGLELFADNGIRTPEIIAHGVIENHPYLLLEFLEEGQGSQKDLGKLVAKMHRIQQENKQFGFEFPYQGGSICFENEWTNSWLVLFVNQRLDVLNEELIDKGLWNRQDVETFKDVRKIIVESLSQHESESSLLHGDLWSGNFMFLKNGEPALFDPSPLYGDREFDIGITTVFGGFNHDFYEAYQAEYPLKSGYEFRLRFYRLYLLMVHLHKFGRSYYTDAIDEMERILRAEKINYI
ncbi:fructosamine kinase family protein [Fundicoccus sp. Sow4_H7]|uniref:fructosamine kinase family protein n=1 Tax=Fundicoccus sp. Sow4_H7 TaxID=3438784 RepID=UPI003F8E87A9